MMKKLVIVLIFCIGFATAQINLTSLEIKTDSICANQEEEIIFIPKDIKGDLTILTSQEFFINHTSIYPDVTLDHSNSQYVIKIDNITKGLIEIEISANQQGKIINQTKLIEVKSCFNTKNRFESRLARIDRIIKENQNFFIFSGISIFILIMLAIMIKEIK